MGGTSTDVSHYAGEFERELRHPGRRRADARAHDEHPHRRGGWRLRAPLRRRAATASAPTPRAPCPGPACYRRGGPLTVTDANVMLGRIQPDHFPAVFGPDGDQPLDAETVRERFAALAERDRARRPATQRTPEEVAAGFLEIAVLNMANAVKKISVQRGHDVTRYALTCFGGAGGQHACAVADALGVNTVLVPPLAGRALRVRHRSRGRDRHARAVRRGGAGPRKRCTRVRDTLRRAGRAHPRRTARRRHPRGDAISTHARVQLRYAGTDAAPARPAGHRRPR